MEAEQVVQGRRLGPEDIGLVRHWLATEPGWNRTRLSRELCRRWGWHNEAGRLKDMACRTLLPVKDIYVRPLFPDFRRRLCAPACSLPEGRAGR